MAASIIPFRRDISKILAELISIRPNMSSDELVIRHDKIIRLRTEAYHLNDAELCGITPFDEVTNALHAFHAIALRAGVPVKIVKEFNEKRSDWKMFKADRETWPAYQKM